MSELYIGLMSGTSLDGIDVVLVDFAHPKPKLLATLAYELNPTFRAEILSLRQPSENEVQRLAELDVKLGNEFANAALTLLKNQKLKNDSIQAIGSHGQTIRHFPNQTFPFTIQVGDPNIIAAKTGITTVSDFRRRDLAHGGQGAPLVPAFHLYLFSDTHKNRVIANIGGIANITVLSSSKPVFGFDTGPGNTLMDAWAKEHLQKNHDENGAWAKRGNVIPELLQKLLSDPYFKKTPPKSTGQELFNISWLKSFLNPIDDPIDVQATLAELTAQSLMDAITQQIPNGEILICGGGVHNQYLMDRIRYLAENYSVDSTEKYGVPPDWIEAMAFAWLAKQTLNKKPGNLKEVTGAKCETILGGVYYA